MDLKGRGTAGTIAGGPHFGSRLRAARKERRIGVRELSREIDISASMISQIELGRVMPSVKTLYAITSVLGISLDELLFMGEPEASSSEQPPVSQHSAETILNSQEALDVWSSPGDDHPNLEVRASPVEISEARPHDSTGSSGLIQRADARRTLTLASGVRWELLNSIPDPLVEFQQAVYEVGGESAAAGALLRHGGHEYGLVLEGRLGITVGFDTYEMGPGDSISFDSSLPHRLFNLAAEATTVIWVVVGRREDQRVTGAG